MSRRTAAAAEEAARAANTAASEAARVMQARGQEVRAERAAEPPPEAEKPRAPKPEQEKEPISDEKIAQLREANPNEQARDEIFERSDKRHGLKAVETKKEPEQQEQPENPEPQQTAPEAQTTAPETQQQPEQAIETVKVKVDGQEFDVTKAEVEAVGGVHNYQIQKALENRLKEAAADRAEAKRMLELAQRLQTPQEPAKPPVSDEEFIKSRLDTIRFGTPEEGARALSEIQQRNRMDPGAIMLQTTATMKFDLAYEKFKSEFSDLFANPMLSDLVQIQLQKGLAPAVINGKPDYGKISQIDLPRFFTNIGNQVRSVVGRPSQPATVATAPATTGVAAPGPTSQVSEKEAKKASIANPPTTAARAALPEEPKPETREDVIREMRKSRGLPID